MSYIEDGKEVARAIKVLHSVFETNGLCSGWKVQYDSYPFTLVFTLRYKKEDIAGFTLIQQKNCCGILISTRTFVRENHSNRGIAQDMMPLKFALAKEFGYSLILATVNMSGNPSEAHILEKYGWKLGESFVNARTKNTIGVFTRVIEDNDALPKEI